MLGLAGGEIVFGHSRNSPNSFVLKADEGALASKRTANLCIFIKCPPSVPWLLFLLQPAPELEWRVIISNVWVKGLICLFSCLIISFLKNLDSKILLPRVKHRLYQLWATECICSLLCLAQGESDLKSYACAAPSCSAPVHIIDTALRQEGRGVRGREKSQARMQRSHKRRQDIRSSLVMNIHEKPEVGVIPEFKENGLIPPRYSILTQGSHLFPPPVLSVRNVTAFKGNKTKILPTVS